MASLTAQTVPAAYGVRIEGIDPTPFLALRDAEHWPVISVERVIADDGTMPTPAIGEEHATAVTPAGVLRMDRGRQTLSIASPSRLALSDVVHPGLWPAAAVFARWRGLETLHAGAFLDGAGDAWALMADSGGGKSSLLAALARIGIEILVDDLLVIDGMCCYAGPRCIDLRPEAARRLGRRAKVETVRSTSRGRLTLGPCRPTARLRGFVELGWGESVSIERLAPSVALARLARHRRVVGLGSELGQLLDLAGLTMLRLTRPRDWNAERTTVRALTTAITAR